MSHRREAASVDGDEDTGEQQLESAVDACDEHSEEQTSVTELVLGAEPRRLRMAKLLRASET